MKARVMPLTTIETCKKRPSTEIKYLLDSVYQAQIEAFKVPDTDRQLRYAEVSADHFYIPPNRTNNFTLVTIQMFPGRTIDAKRAFYKSIVERFSKIGISKSDVFISLQESPRENWSLSDGVAASDL
jgi:phenylpyruvate tautomerase PptA (4-oxalocrotonate tautomerase family)